MPNPTGGRGRTLSLVTPASDVAFYAQREYAREPVLVLGAADGRVAFEIAARGSPVVAVEPSKVMLSIAEDRKSQERADTASRVRLVHGDLRAVRLQESFEAVVAPQNAIGLLETLDDLDAFFETARAHLRPAGTLVFDATNPMAIPMTLPLRREEPHRKGHPMPDEPVMPPAPISFVPHLHERTRSDSTEAIHRLKSRPFTVDEIDDALKAAGFVALERFGTFEGKPFDATDALQIVVATLEPYGLKH